MQMDVPEAEKAISAVSEENILIVLHACDSRSGVKKALKASRNFIYHGRENERIRRRNDFTEESTDEHNAEK